MVYMRSIVMVCLSIDGRVNRLWTLDLALTLALALAFLGIIFLRFFRLVLLIRVILDNISF